MPFHFSPIPIVIGNDRRQCSVSFSERLIELERSQRRPTPQRVRLANRHDAVAPQQCVGVGQPTVGLRVRWIELDGLLKVVPRFLKFVDRVFGPMIAATKIVLVGPCIVRVTRPTGVAVPDRHPKA